MIFHHTPNTPACDSLVMTASQESRLNYRPEFLVTGPEWPLVVETTSDDAISTAEMCHADDNAKDKSTLWGLTGWNQYLGITLKLPWIQHIDNFLRRKKNL